MGNECQKRLRIGIYPLGRLPEKIEIAREAVNTQITSGDAPSLV